MQSLTQTILGLAGLSLIAASVSAQNYSMDWRFISSGGGTSVAGAYAITAVVDGPVAGSMSGGGYMLESGFTGLLGGPVDLVFNGSFENIAATFAPDGNQVMSLLPGSTNIPGWTVVNAELLWGNNINAFGPRTPYGAFAVDLTGYHDSPPYAGVSQILTTTPAQNYRLTFSLGADQDVPAYRGPLTVGVTAGSVSNTFTLAPSSGATGNVWMSFTLDFVAASNATPLTFVGTAAAGGAYLGLDNVTVVPFSAAPPEFRITAVERFGADLRLSFDSAAGFSYAVQARENLATGDWNTLPGTTNSGTGGTVQATVTNAFLAPRQFYRVWRLP